MTTTMPRMAQVINILKERNIREQFKVIVGGGPISKSFADSIGADGYSANANNAISLVQNLLTEKQV
jgi:methanogenic corrinoid protein MtbC1